jgi:hypothetical protein
MFDSGHGGFTPSSFITESPITGIPSPALERHVHRLFEALPDQAQKRLMTLAVSAGVGVMPANHALLSDALADIAGIEGTLEDEVSFAELYLGEPWVCAWLAEKSRMPTSSAPGAKKRLNNRKKKASEPPPMLETRLEEEQRYMLEHVLEQKAIAIDGEGVTLPDGRHVYRYIAACLSDGTLLAEMESEDGFEASEILRFITSLPRYDSNGTEYLGIFGYGLGYDQAKWFESMPNKALFELYHASGMGPAAVVKRYALNFFGRCLRIIDRRAPKGERITLVWDILKAFQAKFVKALEAWGVGKEHLEFLSEMKERRGNFTLDMKSREWKDTKRYCKLECVLLAELVETYVAAHSRAGIDLAGKYHGAGSTGEAVLRMMNAAGKLATKDVDESEAEPGKLHEVYDRKKSAFSRAFFGGRAEVSRLGPTGMKGEGFEAWDIASAYPHALYELPCAVHGMWRHAKATDDGFEARWRRARYACVRYELLAPEETPTAPVDRKVLVRRQVMGIEGLPGTSAWGPLPYRTKKGSIVFAEESPGGWAWRPELLAAERSVGRERLVLHEAWLLESECRCARPFLELGRFYLERLAWGKEGPGIVLKLGMNSCYGKTAQTVGNPKFACRVIAGSITATTRGRILDAISAAPDPWSVMYVATDGILTDSPLHPPDPEPNETSEAAQAKDKAMLGAWEQSCHDLGLFIVQPGFWFANHTDSAFIVKKRLIKTRGTHQDIVLERRAAIMEQWQNEALEPVKEMPPRIVFRGVKTSILPPKKEDGRYRRKKSYGRWESEEHAVKYVINPKRSSPQPVHTWQRLYTWRLDRQGNDLSAEYKKDTSAEALIAQMEEMMRDEQPDFYPGDGGPIE